jgi:predicted DNA-binding transcriptional regulator AlpA
MTYLKLNSSHHSKGASVIQPIGDAEKQEALSLLNTKALACCGSGNIKDELMCTKAAAKRLGIGHQTLEKWRSQNRGPRFVKIGRKAVRYRSSDLTAFVEEGFNNV